MLQQKVKKNFLLEGQNTLKMFNDIYVTWQSIRRQLLSLDEAVFGVSIDDVEDQLALMYLENFAYEQPKNLWQEFPRYLQALELRLDRLPNNLKRDLDAIDQVDPWMEKLFKFKGDERLYDFYKMVEEFRISLFSQPMKTKMPVSPKRLQSAWSDLLL